MLTRNVQLNIRVTPEEKKLFEQAAARCGLTLSQYIRMRLHNQMPRRFTMTCSFSEDGGLRKSTE